MTSALILRLLLCFNITGGRGAAELQGATAEIKHPSNAAALLSAPTLQKL